MPRKNSMKILIRNLQLTTGSFGDRLSLFFSNKTPKCNNITLIEENEIINDNSACVEILNNCFSDVMKELNIDRTLHVTSPVVAHSPVETYIKMFKTHPSITKIIELGITANHFCFKPTSDNNIHEILKNIDSSKAYQKNNIPPIILKENADICVMIIRSDLNLCIEKGIFPSNLKNADITPFFIWLAENDDLSWHEGDAFLCFDN